VSLTAINDINVYYQVRPKPVDSRCEVVACPSDQSNPPATDDIHTTSDYRPIEIRQYMRSYWVGRLNPGGAYEFCLGYLGTEGWAVPLNCSPVTTPSLEGGLDTQSTITLASMLLAGTVPVSLCLLVTMVRRHRRRKAYDEPGQGRSEETGSGQRLRCIETLSQIPLDSLYQPQTTPLSTSLTTLIS
jgi:hypothetical protein